MSAQETVGFYAQLGSQGGGADADLMPPLKGVGGEGAVLAFHQTQDPISDTECSPAFGVTTNGMGVLSFAQNQRGECRVSDVSTSLTRGGGTPGQSYPVVMTVAGEGVTHALTSEGHDASEDGTGRGTPIVVPNIPASYARGAGHNKDEIATVQTGRPRRLTPLECERLMGWPDGWTKQGVDGTGYRYNLTDSARYKLCGNGVGAPVAAWIGRQLRRLHTELLGGVAA